MTVTTSSTLAALTATPLPPRFTVRHTWPCHWQLMDGHASSTKASVVGDYTDFDAARIERDRRNSEYFAQVTR